MKPLVLALICGLLPLTDGLAKEARPFPRHTAYAPGTLKPNHVSQEQLDRAAADFYRLWKARYLRAAGKEGLYVFFNAGRIEPSHTLSVSEGHGYGMLAAVLMAGADPEAHRDFDALYRYYRAHPAIRHPALMAWRQLDRGETAEDRESATDGDLDIALALLMADRQWGSAETDYRSAALRVLAAIQAAETDLERHTLTLGSWVDDESRYRRALRPSDFMPAHLKSFSEATGDPVWIRIADSTYGILAETAARFSPKAGLVPDFIVWKKGDPPYRPAPAHYLEGPHDGAFYYNAGRVPWRVATDALLSGDPRAGKLLEPLNAWIFKAVQGDPAKINAGYRLDGVPLASDRSAAFTGPFAVAAMLGGPGGQAWLNALWDHLVSRPPAADDYFGNTVKLLTLIVLSGNWWQP